MRETFYWLKSVIHDEVTYTLVHLFAADDGAARVFVRREYYVSTSYNAEQTLAGFLPSRRDGRRLHRPRLHRSGHRIRGLDQAGIGSKVMASQMQEIYEAERQKSERPR